MINNQLEFIKSRVEFLQVAGLTDNTLQTSEYLRVAELMLREQDDKNIITDGIIDYNDEIIDIELVGDCETIDISVTGDSLFYCNGILTKNSIGLAATADVIVSIFQNDEDREMSIIKIGMMKNRFGPRGDTCSMAIDYNTLTIEESDEVIGSTDASVLNSLESLMR